MNQDDFRKLLESGGSGGKGAYGGQRKLTQLDLEAVRKLSAKKSHKKKGGGGGDKAFQREDDEADHNKAPTGGQYRDRAAERRQGINIDMADANDFSHLAIEESKPQGGDEKHSHVLKGLDFALLAQLKREKQKLQEATAQEKMKIQAASTKDEAFDPNREPAFKTRLGRMVFFYACQSRPIGKKLQKSELFLPGRTTYTFNLSSTDSGSGPVVVHRTKEDCPEPDDVVSGMVDDLTITDVARALENHKNEKKLRRKRREEESSKATETTEEQEESKEEKGAHQEQKAEEDEDEDIFPDAGDYVPAYLRDSDPKEKQPVPQTTASHGYFSNLSASIAEAEKAEKKKEEEADKAWRDTLQKAAIAQAQKEKEEAMKERAAKLATLEDTYSECFPEYQAAGAYDSDDDDEGRAKKRKGGDTASEVSEDEKSRRKKQKQGSKLENDLRKINQLMDAK